MLYKPTVVSDEEVESVGGLRPLTKEEKVEIAKMIDFPEKQITNLPLVNIRAEENIPLPNFAEILDVIMQKVPNAHVHDSLKEYFKDPKEDAPVAKGLIEWKIKDIEKKKVLLSVYYRYHQFSKMIWQ